MAWSRPHGNQLRVHCVVRRLEQAPRNAARLCSVHREEADSQFSIPPSYALHPVRVGKKHFPGVGRTEGVRRILKRAKADLFEQTQLCRGDRFDNHHFVLKDQQKRI